MKPVVAPCTACGNLILRDQVNRKFCRSCSRSRYLESKRIWQAKWRARSKKVHPRSESAQREAAAYSEDYEEILAEG